MNELLPDDTILLPEDLKDSLQQQCDRLSELEIQVISLLAKESEPVTPAQLLEKGGMTVMPKKPSIKAKFFPPTNLWAITETSPLIFFKETDGEIRKAL